MLPNILYLHCHDAGRYIGPYGHRVPAPNLQRLARRGVTFRQAFCAGPTCSPSRAALLTGQACHSAGMLGLAHMGWSLTDYRQHLLHTLSRTGYRTVLAGMQHIADPFNKKAPRDIIGYDQVLRGRNGGSHENTFVVHDRGIANVAADFLLSPAARKGPLFMSVGFIMPHRPFIRSAAGAAEEDPRFVNPPAPLPNTAETRRDMADYVASAESMDACCGTVLNALENSGMADNTLVIATTDHGIAFPGMKCTLTDHGMGVYLIMRGPGGFSGGKAVDAMVSQIDLYPTLCELLHIESPAWLQGKSLLPLVSGEETEINEEIFGEVTYHSAYEPQRAIRTRRWKLIKRFDPEWPRRVGPNCDDGESKTLLSRQGWLEQKLPAVQLYDLLFDPCEANNLANHPEHAEMREELEKKLDNWMHRTDDPLLNGPVPLPDKAVMYPVDIPSYEGHAAGRNKFSA